MKSLTLFLLIFGIVLITMGYMEIYLSSQNKNKVIEYRFVPYSVYDQIGTIEVSDKHNDLFELSDPTFSRGSLYYSNLV